jgi:hypothetical protein
MNVLCPNRPRAGRFRVTRLEERIAPAGSLVNLQVAIGNINVPITVANNNIQVGIQALDNNVIQILPGLTSIL